MYTAESLSLCVLETLVHAGPDLLPGDLTAFSIGVPRSAYDDALAERERNPLPVDWAQDIEATRDLGETWAEGGDLLLAVPSVIVPRELCVLINPRHPGSKSVGVVDQEAFRFDERLLR